MFKSTVYLTKLKARLKDCLGQVNAPGDAILIVEGCGAPLKVIITQEEYLMMKGRIAAFEETTDRAPTRPGSRSDIMASVLERQKQINDQIREFGADQ